MPSSGGVDSAILKHFRSAGADRTAAGTAQAIGHPEAYTAERIRHLSRAGWLHQDRLPLTREERRDAASLADERRAVEDTIREMSA
jgi:hypothetical protein